MAVALAAHSEQLADLAASYAFGIARNHPFVDANKRTAAVASETFLLLNDDQLACTDVELVTTFLALAAGDLTVEALAAWFREHVKAAWGKCPPESPPAGILSSPGNFPGAALAASYSARLARESLPDR